MRAPRKPLYYVVSDGVLAFASEIKTLLALLGRRFSLDRDTIGQFIGQGLTDATTRTFFDGITRLEPGSFVELDLREPIRSLTPVRFQPPQHEADSARMPLDEFIVELRKTFVDSVRLRLRSDVPVGVLLSGGVDSSSIAAAAQALAGRSGASAALRGQRRSAVR